MQKVLLINPSYAINTTPYAVLRQEPPVGLLSLASYLFERGYECDIVNTAFEEIDWEKIKKGHYILAGFTVFVGDFLKNARILAAKIKKVNPKLPVCFGGVMASLFPEQILRQFKADFIVRYEGEYTLTELLQYLLGSGSLEKIRGLSYRDGQRIINNPPRFLEENLDNFPPVRWEMLGKKCNERQVPYYFRIMTSKGCPYSCGFCYNHSVDEEIKRESPPWRYRTADHVITEIEDIHRLTKSRVFTFGDDNFLLKKERVSRIMNYLRKNNFYIEQCIGHLNNITDDVIEMMGGSVQTVVYAIESASPKMVNLLNKHIDLKKVPEVNRKLFNKGITTIHNFIIGLVEERDKDLRLNVELMLRLKEVNPYVRSLCYLFMPLPMTPLNTYIESKLGFKASFDLCDYEDASFDSGDPAGRKFRPWLNKERYNFLHNYSKVFNDVFQTNSISLSRSTLNLLKSERKLREMFKGIENVRKPKQFYRPYVLDRVLRNEKVDLLNDLKRYA